MTNYIHTKTIGAANAPLVFTFHGTGGDEHQFHGFARQILPNANVISPRGDVSEQGMNRYFRRTAEGIYDMPDLQNRTRTMADFLRGHVSEIRPPKTIGLGYSNGANILASVAFLNPEMITRLVLLHPLIPFTPPPNARLRACEILICAGKHDSICPPSQTQALADYFVAQGARVTLRWFDAGHEITQAEAQAATAFIQAP